MGGMRSRFDEGQQTVTLEQWRRQQGIVAPWAEVSGEQPEDVVEVEEPPAVTPASPGRRRLKRVGNT
jgi:hypothetical protein